MIRAHGAQVIRTKVSYHSHQLRAPALYASSLNGPLGTRLLIAVLFERALAGKPFTPSQAKLARLVHRSDRTVRRWLDVGVRRGWIRVVRRGRKLSNLYRLSRPLWARLVGQQPPRLPTALQATMWSVGRHLGLSDGQMARRGVAGRR